MNASTHGVFGVYHFTDMVSDTIKEHGLLWTYNYYVRVNKIPAWEFFIFAGVLGDLRQLVWE